jgi:S-formylglutathione hydrolase FrmB
MSPKREAAATMLAVSIGVTGTLAVVYVHRWYYGVAFIALLFAWIATATGTPGPNNPPHRTRWMP